MNFIKSDLRKILTSNRWIQLGVRGDVKYFDIFRFLQKYLYPNTPFGIFVWKQNIPKCSIVTVFVTLFNLFRKGNLISYTK